MAFFSKRAISPVERFERALKDKQAARENLAERLNAAEATLGERCDAAERLAIAGAADAQLDRAETNMRAAEDRAMTLRAALTQLDEQIVMTERELADTKAQRDRDMMADEVEKMVAAIERAAPGFDAGATALVAAVTQSAASMLEATDLAANVDAVRREILWRCTWFARNCDPPRCVRARAIRTLRPAQRPSQRMNTNWFIRSIRCFGGRTVRSAGCRPMHGSNCQKRCYWSRCGTSMWTT